MLNTHLAVVEEVGGVDSRVAALGVRRAGHIRHHRVRAERRRPVEGPEVHAVHIKHAVRAAEPLPRGGRRHAHEDVLLAAVLVAARVTARVDRRIRVAGLPPALRAGVEPARAARRPAVAILLHQHCHLEFRQRVHVHLRAVPVRAEVGDGRGGQRSVRGARRYEAGERQKHLSHIGRKTLRTSADVSTAVDRELSRSRVIDSSLKSTMERALRCG